MYSVILVKDKYYIDDVKAQFKSVVEVPSVIDGKEIYGITSNAFTGKIMKSVILSEGIQYIADYAFEGCNELESVIIPKTVNHIGEYAFSECVSLKTVTFEQKSELTKLEKGTFANCGALVNVVLPDQLDTIGEWCFFQCKELQNVQMPSTVTSINEFAFARCQKLLNVLFKDDAQLQTVKDFAFLDCSNVEIQLPITVKNFGKGSFENVLKLELAPGNRVKVPYLRAFKGCNLYK